MNALLTSGSGDLWHVAGWTMLHFLWLGTLAGLVAGVCRMVLRRTSANLHYAAAVAWFAVLAVLPIGIGAWMLAKPQAMSVAENLVIARPMQIAPTAPGSAGGQIGTSGEIAHAPNAPKSRVALAVAANSQTNPRPTRKPGAPRGLADVVAVAAEYLPWVWLVGTPLTFVLLATGVMGAERLRRASRVIDDGPIAEACTRLVEALRIGRRVTVAVCERIAAPVLVGIVRPIILLPPAALTGWSPDEIEMVLLHELAHVRRWDNLVNLVQRLVEAMLFFHPAVWLVSSWVRREREACCDAVVVGRTNQPYAYAELLINLSAHFGEPSEPGRPRPRGNALTRGRGRPGSLVSSAMAAGPLRGRIRRILGLEDDPMLISGKSLGVVMSSLLLAATLVVLNLPTRGQADESTAKTHERLATEDKEGTETKNATRSVENDKSTGDTMPKEKHVDEFRSKFILGDKNRYETWVYEITDAPNTKLRLDWIVEMLKRDPSEPKPYFAYNWTNDWTRLEIIAPTEGQKVVESMIKSAQGQKLNLVRFVVGASRFADGDKITITEVRGTAETLKPGNIYWIKGTYKLGSHDRAMLAAYTTATDAANGTSPSLSVQSTDVARGEGTFSLFLPMSYRGWPHVSFYPADHGESFGGVYFGTGDSVLQQWWDSNEAIDATATEATEMQQSDDDVRRVTIAISDDQTATAESQPGRLRLQIRKTENKSGTFPSLEDQKLADIIYRRLGLELEPIGEADLNRVKALGYDGGLKATHGAGGIQSSDILVGLHVWPTTRLKDVVDILNRDDLTELNPLKFYVVHRKQQYPDGGVDDEVVTGRISVSLDARPSKVSTDKTYSAPTPAAVVTSPIEQPSPHADGKATNDLYAPLDRVSSMQNRVLLLLEKIAKLQQDRGLLEATERNTAKPGTAVATMLKAKLAEKDAEIKKLNQEAEKLAREAERLMKESPDESKASKSP